MDGKFAERAARHHDSALELPELPGIVAALTSAVEVGVASITGEIEAYFNGHPGAREDPALQSLARLPALCGDLSALGDDYDRLARVLADASSDRTAQSLDLLPILREALTPLAHQIRLPSEAIWVTIEPERLCSALAGFLAAFPELGEPGTESSILIERSAAGWSLLVSIPGRVGSPADRGLLAEKSFPMPPSTGGSIPDHEVELVRCRETLIQLGANLSSQIGRPMGVSFRLDFLDE